MINVSISGDKEVMAYLSGLSKQIAYAASVALNQTGKRIVEAMPDEMDTDLDRPTPFTKNGVAILQHASKTQLEAVVGFRPIQANYMKWQVTGGEYQPGAKGLRIPAAIKLNEFGNVPKGVIAQLMAVARKEQGLKKATSRRVKVSAKVDLFYGDPKDQSGKVWPRGIYKAVNGALIPLIIFPVKVARYRARFDFTGKAHRIVDRVWQNEFNKAIDAALRTARD